MCPDAPQPPLVASAVSSRAGGCLTPAIPSVPSQPHCDGDVRCGVGSDEDGDGVLSSDDEKVLGSQDFLLSTEQQAASASAPCSLFTISARKTNRGPLQRVALGATILSVNNQDVVTFGGSVVLSKPSSSHSFTPK
jgi:hypothetical protein